MFEEYKRILFEENILVELSIMFKQLITKKFILKLQNITGTENKIENVDPDILTLYLR